MVMMYSLSILAQNNEALDEKSGYKGLKLGASISSIQDEVRKDSDTSYLIKDISKYEIEGNKIDEIRIGVSKRDNTTIEAISLKFDESLGSRAVRYKFYKNLFSDAFGEPTEKSGDNSTWVGKKAKLICIQVIGLGYCIFTRIQSEEEQKSNAEEAINKF